MSKEDAHTRGQKDASAGIHPQDPGYSAPEDEKRAYDQGYYSTRAQIDATDGEYHKPVGTFERVLGFDGDRADEANQHYAEVHEATKKNNG
ncbi:MAG: hypothetical protein UX81_C0013G0009 [Parcubacteria group bacterium GW2011_GWA2_47_12]|nr:MAG: hypothetical protein UX81_C0013G0009 [Parcubacteria group bacterium GW2011_GWA2_47_12]